MTERKQVRPAAEGWTQAKDETGKPLLQFAEPKRKQPPKVRLMMRKPCCACFALPAWAATGFLLLRKKR